MTTYGIQKTEPLIVIKIRLVVLHLGALGVLFVPFHPDVLWVLAATFFLRMFGMEGGYHRYFSHRAFKTSRVFQFILAVLATSSGQRGPLWWASNHRVHHRHSDEDGDAHSPRMHGLWHAHLGWLVERKNVDTNLDLVPDFARYPELRWLNKFHYVPIILLLAGVAVAGAKGWLGPNVGGWQAVFWGFFLSTLLVLHFTLAVNSLVHCAGRWGGSRRYAIGDASVNHAWLAIPTMGASWHNNHHRYGAAARAGFAWWEIDLTYTVLRLLQACQIVRELREVPSEVLVEGGLGTAEGERAIA
jgi:stearoyl-CoA desaturase (delta-9 desaturase)